MVALSSPSSMMALRMHSGSAHVASRSESPSTVGLNAMERRAVARGSSVKGTYVTVE